MTLLAHLGWQVVAICFLAAAFRLVKDLVSSRELVTRIEILEALANSSLDMNMRLQELSEAVQRESVVQAAVISDIRKRVEQADIRKLGGRQ